MNAAAWQGLEEARNLVLTDPVRSRELLERAERLFSEGGEKRGRAECLGELACVLVRLSEEARALQCALQAASEFRALGDVGAEGTALFWAARAAGISRPEDERELWTRAARLLVAAKLYDHACIAYGALANFNVQAGDSHAAERDFREAMRLAGSEVRSSGSAGIALGLARCLLGSGRIEEARDLAKRLLAFWKGEATLAARLGEAEAMVVDGDALSALGRVEEARSAYSAALTFQLGQGRGRAAREVEARLEALVAK